MRCYILADRRGLRRDSSLHWAGDISILKRRVTLRFRKQLYWRFPLKDVESLKKDKSRFYAKMFAMRHVLDLSLKMEQIRHEYSFYKRWYWIQSYNKIINFDTVW